MLKNRKKEVTDADEDEIVMLLSYAIQNIKTNKEKSKENKKTKLKLVIKILHFFVVVVVFNGKKKGVVTLK